MDFEFDPAKSLANRQKHGINFKDAQKLWDDPALLEAPASSLDEPRHLVIGMIGSKHGSAVVTYRADRARIISVRRSRPSEIARYESL